MDPKGKRVTVVGLARSGVGAANLLSAMGADVTVTDIKPEEELRNAVSRLLPGIQRVLGEHPDRIFSSADMIIISPGVPQIRQINEARTRGIPVIGELELAWQVMQEISTEQRAQSIEQKAKSKDSKESRLGRVAGATGVRSKESDIKQQTTAPGRQQGMPFLAITGSNGKSTTTTLLDLMLKQHGSRTVLGGNIGSALTEACLSLVRGEAELPEFIVAEVSSFQLEAINGFRPHIAAILNVTPDHMDRYHSLEEYAAAKAGIYANQGRGDCLVLNADDAGTMKLSGALSSTKGPEHPSVFYFSRRQEVSGVYASAGVVYSTIATGTPVPLIAAGDIAIRGVHNLENAMAASAMALLAGCGHESVAGVLREFTGLEHRLEFVRELNGVRYINDSKGTNVDAVLKSMEGFEEPVVLIAGGRDKSGDFTVLRDIVSRKARAVVLIGEAAGKIGKALEGASVIIEAGSLPDAVHKSRAAAAAGDVVLLSPACASFDMFRDFEDRGRQFKQLVMGLES